MRKKNVSHLWKVLFVMVMLLGTTYSSVNAQRYQQVKIVDGDGTVNPPNPYAADMVINFSFSGDYVIWQAPGISYPFKYKYQRTDGTNDVYFIEAYGMGGSKSYNDKNVMVVSSDRRFINHIVYDNAYQLNYKVVYEKNEGIRYD